MTGQASFYIVNAFTQEKFGGNPAAVHALPKWLPDASMQAIAAQHNLSATAFFVLDENANNPTQLRWLSPTREVEFCGHATLAAAHIVLAHLQPNRQKITFTTKRGNLEVEKTPTPNQYEMTLPLEPSEEIFTAPDSDLIKALGNAPPQQYFKGAHLMLIYKEQEEIESLSPDFSLLKKYCATHNKGVIATAPANPATTKADFVSRVFVPAHGVNEDSATGSAHCQLAPYWSARLKTADLTASQLSPRGGHFVLHLHKTALTLQASCIDFATGSCYT